jgi:hypothetical protein
MTKSISPQHKKTKRKRRHLSDADRHRLAETMRRTMRTHGESHTVLHGLWMAMKSRCQNPNNQSYFRYGKKGIRVCRRWQKFENFRSDMGDRPPGMTLERKDGRKGYNPDNVVWADRTAQAVNRSTSRMISRNGETLCIRHWAKKLGVSEMAIHRRIERGWPVQTAISKGKYESARTILICGRPICVWAKISGINRLTIYSRLSSGWKAIDAVTTPVRAR